MARTERRKKEGEGWREGRAGSKAKEAGDIKAITCIKVEAGRSGMEEGKGGIQSKGGRENKSHHMHIQTQ